MKDLFGAMCCKPPVWPVVAHFQSGYPGLGGANCLLCKLTRSCQCSALCCSAFACEHLLVVGMPGCLLGPEGSAEPRTSVPCKHSGMPHNKGAHKQLQSNRVHSRVQSFMGCSLFALFYEVSSFHILAKITS